MLSLVCASLCVLRAPRETEGQRSKGRESALPFTCVPFRRFYAIRGEAVALYPKDTRPPFLREYLHLYIDKRLLLGGR